MAATGETLEYFAVECCASYSTPLEVVGYLLMILMSCPLLS